MGLLTYNGIKLPYSQVTHFSQDVEYDDVGNVDWCCTKYDIRVTSFLNIDYIQTISSDFAGVNAVDSASDIMKAIRSQLLRPRRSLSFLCNGRELIPQPTGVGTVDSKNGPLPQSCSIDQLTNYTFQITYHITASYWEKVTAIPGSSGIEFSESTGSDVLYNRWTETVDIDNCMYSKRTRDGKYIIRSDNANGVTADRVRSDMAVLGVPNGFLRESSRYTISPDGLGLSYTIVDKEVYKLPPSGAYEASGEYIGSTTRSGGKVFGECRVRLKGCKSEVLSSQPDLVHTAVVICATKLQIKGPAKIIDARVRVGMYDNTVEVHMSAMMNAVNGTIAGTNGLAGGVGFLKNVCFTPLSDNANPKMRYEDRGTASLILQAARYYDPSLRDNKLVPSEIAGLFDTPFTGKNSQMNNGLDIGTAGVTQED